MTFGVQNHKNPKKRHFCEKPRKLAKTRKLGGVVLGVENRGFPGGVEKRRFSGVQNADFRVSRDFGTPRQNTYYLVCRHPPGGSIFTPPKTPKNTPPDHHNIRCGFGVEFGVFPGFPDMLQKPPKSSVSGFHPKWRFSGFCGRMPIALHTNVFDDAIIVVDPSSWCSWDWILNLQSDLGTPNYVSTHQHDDGGTMIVSFEQHDASILVTGRCTIRTCDIGPVASNLFTKASRNSISFIDRNDVGCHHGAWSVIGRMVRDRSSTNTKLCFRC